MIAFMRSGILVFLIASFFTVVRPFELKKTYAMISSPVFKLEGQIIQHIGTKPHRIRKFYNRTKIHNLAQQIYDISVKWNIYPETILSIIELESNFYPKATHLNTNGTIDRGLTQQNSEYVQARCRRSLNRNCTTEELYKPQVSLMLMTERFKECRRYSYKAFLVCYNSSVKAKKYLRTGKQPKYLKTLLELHETFQ